LDKGIIYYTDNRLKGPILDMSRKTVRDAGLPITSCSLNTPIELGDNYVVYGERSYPTMAHQILTALRHSKATYVFFCEHDVLYHKSHFDFTPYKDDVYFYNLNNYRWDYPKDRAIQYDGLTSLSMMCCNRKLAITHYEIRERLIAQWGLDKLRSREPRWARRFGYEPGTKKRRRGGVSDEESERWWSDYPCIDVRHKKCFSAPKTRLKDFKHLPTGWKEVTLKEIDPYGKTTIINTLRDCGYNGPILGQERKRS